MNLFGMMQISGSALRMERTRAEIVAVNMANTETTRTEDGKPYQRQTVSIESAQDGFEGAMAGFGLEKRDRVPEGGVVVSEIASSANAVQRRYDPSHPDADANGYVSYPDINPVTEMVDLMGASRSYGLNVSALQAEKNMLTASLDLLK